MDTSAPIRLRSGVGVRVSDRVKVRVSVAAVSTTEQLHYNRISIRVVLL